MQAVVPRANVEASRRDAERAGDQLAERTRAHLHAGDELGAGLFADFKHGAEERTRAHVGVRDDLAKVERLHEVVGQGVDP